jgi:NAD(P)-dependent dehydrogenase (short-subunit alcohol dehydrogenase family)
VVTDARNILVTGAAGRIGAAIAGAFAALGDRVVATDLNADKLAAAVAAHADKPGMITPVACDIAVEAEAERMVADAITTLGQIDILVNCAGIFPNAQVVDMETAEWDRVYNINLRAPFIISRAVARQMLDKGIQGAIVNISSGAGSSARTGGSHYCGSKAALEMLTQVLAIELGPRGIRVNAVAPGLILDEVLAHPIPEGTNDYVASILTGIPMRRTGRPEDIANMVVFLASPEAGWVTGSIFGVNGGSQAGRPHLPPSAPKKAQ